MHILQLITLLELQTQKIEMIHKTRKLKLVEATNYKKIQSNFTHCALLNITPLQGKTNDERKQ